MQCELWQLLPRLRSGVATWSLGLGRPGQYLVIRFSEPEEGRLAIFLVDFALDQGPIRGLPHGAA
jgi:hypothetical protein